ncbi:Protein pim1 [Lachnellula occidentalis]|uniref:Protein pim1 n=1 Tax=Lachnellula occidentalis TaxID=215460 RepID=A0A8H8RBL3_9HELO|nr:Protein pim1 [Lachnellula occidentalis]
MPPKKATTAAAKRKQPSSPIKKSVKDSKPAAKRGRPAKATTATKATKATKATTAKVTKDAKPAAKPRGRPPGNAAKKAAPKAAAKPSSKRKASDDVDGSPAPKKAKKEPAASRKIAPLKKPAAAKKAVVPKPPKVLPHINDPPTQVLDVYVFGENSAGELGIGTGTEQEVSNVKRPRLNRRLAADVVGVVQIAAGGMHCVALTHDNKLLTWGVNDQGALGRTTEKANADADDSDDEDLVLNASEAEPREVDLSHFPAGTKFSHVVAADSTSFVVTTTGLVYGWGTFRGNDGLLGFRPDGPKTQSTPVLIPELKDITTLSAGTNHILALNTKGKVFAWGAGEQNQLARKIISRNVTQSLMPRECGLSRKKILTIGCGDYHSFAADDKGTVFAWGLNGFAQCGTESDQDDTSPTISKPTIIEGLQGEAIKQIVGGAHHSIAVTTDGKVLVWGSCQNNQSGVDLSTLPDDAIYKEENGRVRYISKPTVVPGIDGVAVAAGPDNGAAITSDGKVYTWGFNANYQTGQGPVADIPVATVVDNTAVRGKKLVSVGLGGQFGVLGGIPAKAEE